MAVELEIQYGDYIRLTGPDLFAEYKLKVTSEMRNEGAHYWFTQGQLLQLLVGAAHNFGFYLLTKSQRDVILRDMQPRDSHAEAVIEMLGETGG